MTTDFRVVLLPRQEVVARHCTLGEALAYQRGYEEVAGERQRAVIDREFDEPAARGVAHHGSITTTRRQAV
jgi:hypothetical protein